MSSLLSRRPLFALAFLLISAGCLQAQTAATGVDAVRARYTKYEYRVPMRDGVRLFTSIYVPKDTSRTLSFSDYAHALQRRALWHR